MIHIGGSGFAHAISHLLLEVVSAEEETHVPELHKLLLDFGRLGLIIVRGIARMSLSKRPRFVRPLTSKEVGVAFASFSTTNLLLRQSPS